MTPPSPPPSPEPTANQLQAALRGALDTPSPPQLDADLYAEDLFLIAAGRGDELAPARRDHLLEAVATDPGVAALLQDALALAGDAAAPHAETTDESTVHTSSNSAAAAGFAPTLRRSADDAPTLPPPPAFRFPRTAMKAVFALAACLTVALGVWRFADPPTTRVAGDPNDLFNQPGLIVPSQVDDPPANGTAPTLAAATSPRDSALIASVALTAVLGLVLVLLTPGGKPDDAGS